ncbi:MAG: imidazole glycerol phosphate synthase subunit HisH [Actinomycetota bacterium]
MIAILDYGSGNLRSAERAFATTGEEVVVTSDRDICLKADGLVVPGVGAFRACMNGLSRVRGEEIIKQRWENAQPTFGICIGMQILFDTGLEPSAESPGETKGVGIWRGSVSKVQAKILPHMGWNSLDVGVGSRLFAGIEEEQFYFVHSYAAKSAERGIATWGNYGEPFLAAIEDGAFCATQFHPEKSGAAGLKLIHNWIGTL